MVRGISQELTNERYHNATPIADRCAVINKKWTELQKILDELRGTLSRYHDLMSVFSEMEDCLTDMRQLEVNVVCGGGRGDSGAFTACVFGLQQI